MHAFRTSFWDVETFHSSCVSNWSSYGKMMEKDNTPRTVATICCHQKSQHARWTLRIFWSKAVVDCKLCQCHCHRSIVQVMKHPFARACFMLEPPPFSKLSSNCCVNAVPCVRLLDAIASVPEEILGEMAQLTKENSIEGCKASVIVGLFSTAFMLFNHLFIFFSFWHVDSVDSFQNACLNPITEFQNSLIISFDAEIPWRWGGSMWHCLHPFPQLEEGGSHGSGPGAKLWNCLEMGTGTDWSERADAWIWRLASKRNHSEPWWGTWPRTTFEDIRTLCTSHEIIRVPSVSNVSRYVVVIFSLN